MIRGLAILVLLVFAESANAGWLCIKNETKTPLIVFDSKAPVGKRKGYRIQPGETLREFQARPGERQVVIYEAKEPLPAKSLCEGKLQWQNDDAKYQVTLEKQVYLLALVEAKK